jgi:formate transporter
MPDDVRRSQTIDTINFKVIPYFSVLSRENIEKLKPNIQVEHFKAGEVIFNEGDPGDAFYVIAEGKVRVSTNNDKNGAHEIAKLTKNECFGEMALLTGSPRSASIQAVTDVTVMKLLKKDFDQVMKKNQLLAVHFAGLLAKRLNSVRHEVYEPKLSPKEVHARMTQSGVSKANTEGWQLYFLALLAGIYISIGGNAFLVSLDQGAGRIVGGLIFSIGLIFVSVAEAELFTGNIIMMVGLLASRFHFQKVLKNLQIVYVGNFIGSILFAAVIYQTGLFGKGVQPTSLGQMAIKVADAKLSLSFSECFVRGIFCNMLVVLAIIMTIFAKDVISKIFCCMLPVTVFVASSFEHCIANMYFIPIGLLSKGVPLSGQLVMFKNLIPVTLGNIVGGMFIIFIHPVRIKKIARMFWKEPAL